MYVLSIFSFKKTSSQRLIFYSHKSCSRTLIVFVLSEATPHVLPEAHNLSCTMIKFAFYLYITLLDEFALMWFAGCLNLAFGSGFSSLVSYVLFLKMYFVVLHFFLSFELTDN